jgi:hypothetical protein
MDKHEQAVMRGEEAQRLLNSPLFEQAWTDTRRAILDALAVLPLSGDGIGEQQRDLLCMVKVLDRTRSCIEQHVTSGKIAQKQIEKVAKPPFLTRFK